MPARNTERPEDLSILKNRWLIAAMFVHCVPGLIKGDCSMMFLFAALVCHVVFVLWISKKLWPPCETRAVEEADSDVPHADVSI
jgi:hypothetical protein